MRTLKWIAALAVCAYVAGVATLYLAQRSLLYLPPPVRIGPAAAGLPGAEEVFLETGDGERVIAWHVPPRGNKPVVIYFHGNGEVVAWRAARHRVLTADGTGLVALSYRGYMGSSGQPTEPGLLLDAQAAYAFAASRYTPDRIMLWGHSLGTGVAVALAAQRTVAKLILESPYSSVADVAAARFPIVPVRWLMQDQFRSDERIGAVSAPILILHGARDEVIPIAFGERLFALANQPKRFVRYPEGGHVDLDDFGAVTEVQRFITEPTP